MLGSAGAAKQPDASCWPCMNETMTPANQDAPPKPESEATLAAPFCSQTFLHNAELEFRWLIGKLGYDKWTADLRAFQMTAQLALEVRRVKEMWESANDH